MQQEAAVRVRVGAHPAIAGRGLSGQLRQQPAFRVEELLGPVAAHPVLEAPKLVGTFSDAGEGHLVRAPRSLDRNAVDLSWPSPAFWRPENEHRPPRPLIVAARPRGLLDLCDRVERAVERSREALVHRRRFFTVEAARDEDRVPAIALEESHELALGDPCEHRRVRDLPAVQMQDRQDGTIPARVEELGRVPAGGERPGLRLTVPDDTRDHQIRIVEGRPEGVHERVAELSALVDRAGRLRCSVARDPAGIGELSEELAQPFLPRPDVWVQLAVRPLQVGVRDVCRPAVTRTGDEDGAQVAGPDGPVQMRVDEVQAGDGAEVAEQTRLDVLGLQRLPQQRIVEQVDLPDRQIVRSAPIGVEKLELLLSQGGGDRRHGLHLCIDLSETSCRVGCRL